MKSTNTPVREIAKGLWRDNPVMVLLLGLCPALAVTSTAYNGLGMGVATAFVLLNSNIIVSLLKSIIPKSVRIPVYIVVIALFVTIVDMFLKAYLYELSKSLGLFVPLIVVNCLILGRAEAFASKNTIFRSVLDALGMALGFTLALFTLGAIREILGSGTLTLFEMGETIIKFNILGSNYPGVLVMILPPGAFLTLGFMLALKNVLENKLQKNS
jgi:Na+-translocating ferredoxin:NAD+ oxidoreductase subunit E